ncbi:MAG: 4Fe-4S dicluster domain-containing protein [Candidatus Eisenbacteria bacterium]
MARTTDENRPPLRIDPARRRRLFAVLGGNHARYCYQCGACVGDCGSARFHPGFNPREIMLTALLGGLDELLAADSVIWKCSNCYNCYERCPQDVRPVEVIIALKNLAREEGTEPAEARAIQELILKTGRSAPVLASLDRRRRELGLPPLSPIDMTEIRTLLAPDPADPRPPRPDTDAEPRRESGSACGETP